MPKEQPSECLSAAGGSASFGEPAGCSSAEPLHLLPDQRCGTGRSCWMHCSKRYEGFFCVLFALALLGLGGCESARLPAGSSEHAGSTPDAPNLLICVIDAARADHLGCYGYPRPTTPNMDRLAEESLLFENHFTQSTETKLSTASLLTSQYVDSHLAFGDRPLPKSAFTMAGGLRGAGFKTLLFSSNLQASPAYGIGTDFQEVRWVPDLQAATQPGETAHSP
ncbi:MAG: sulfatase-like hydrolase/transferase, partial [Armatimonadota bacterium]